MSSKSSGSDPQAITDALAAAIDAFNEEGHGIPTREDGIESDAEWKTQLTKGCQLLTAIEHISGHGFYTAKIELCFGAIERSVEAYALAEGGDKLDDFYDHNVLGEDASQEEIDRRTGFNTYCYCIHCETQVDLDLDRDEKACPECRSNAVKTIKELVDEQCLVCEDDTFVAEDTGG